MNSAHPAPAPDEASRPPEAEAAPPVQRDGSDAVVRDETEEIAFAARATLAQGASGEGVASAEPEFPFMEEVDLVDRELRKIRVILNQAILLCDDPKKMDHAILRANQISTAILGDGHLEDMYPESFLLAIKSLQNATTSTMTLLASDKRDEMLSPLGSIRAALETCRSVII